MAGQKTDYCIPWHFLRTLVTRCGRRECHSAFADARRNPTTFGLRATRVGEAKNPGPAGTGEHLGFPTDLDCEILGTSDAETQIEVEERGAPHPLTGLAPHQSK